MNEFDCKKCGACCKFVGFAIEYAKQNPDDSSAYNILLREFPFKTDNNIGTCEKLGEDGLCTVYEDRPTICRINDFYTRYKNDKQTLEQYHEEVHQACEKLREL